MRTPKIVPVVPAHNEEVGIVATMESVEAQTTSPDRRIVICDNCTDATPALARSRAGWEVWETVGNTGKKGGALNQAWDRLDGYLADDDYLVTMDADTLLDEHFVENAYAKYQQKRRQGQARRGLRELPGCRARQRARRPAEDGVRARGEDQSLQARIAPVLAGAATMFSVRGLREVHDSRGGLYEPVLTEDYELARAAGPWLRDHGAAQLPRAHRSHADGQDAVGAEAALVQGRLRVAARLRLSQARPQRHRLADLLALGRSVAVAVPGRARRRPPAGRAYDVLPLLLPSSRSPPWSGWCR